MTKERVFGILCEHARMRGDGAWIVPAVVAVLKTRTSLSERVMGDMLQALVENRWIKPFYEEEAAAVQILNIPLLHKHRADAKEAAEAKSRPRGGFFGPLPRVQEEPPSPGPMRKEKAPSRPQMQPRPRKKRTAALPPTSVSCEKRDHAGRRMSLTESIERLLSSLDELPITLRPYQVESIAHTKAWLTDRGGTRRAYVEHATGLGKTILFAALAKYCGVLRLLIIVPTKVLVVQTARKLAPFIEKMMGYLASIPEIRDEEGITIIARQGWRHSNLVITTDESFGRYAKDIAKEYDPDLVVYDECHSAYTGINTEALKHFRDAVIIGFSATPDYLTTLVCPDFVPRQLDNGQILYAPEDRTANHHFETLLDRRTVSWGIEKEWLAPLAWGQVEVHASLDTVPVRDGEGGVDYQPIALTRLLEKEWPTTTQAVCRLYAEGIYSIPDRDVFAVCPSVAAAEEIAAAVGKLGIPSACVTGQTPQRTRDTIFARYRKSGIRFLSSVFVLREGWDAPNAEVCLMLRPTRSRVLYQQYVGRVLRALARDRGLRKVALVLDSVFRDTRFQPLSAPTLFGKLGQKIRPGEILVGPKKINGEEGHISPYTLCGDVEAISIESIALEYSGGKKGFFVVDGDTWGLIPVLAIKADVSVDSVSIWSATAKLRSRSGKLAGGTTALFYSLSDVLRMRQQEPHSRRGGMTSAEARALDEETRKTNPAPSQTPPASTGPTVQPSRVRLTEMFRVTVAEAEAILEVFDPSWDKSRWDTMLRLGDALLSALRKWGFLDPATRPVWEICQKTEFQVEDKCWIRANCRAYYLNEDGQRMVPPDGWVRILRSQVERAKQPTATP